LPVNKTIAIASVAAAALLILPTAEAADDAPKKGGATAVFAPAADLKWTDVPEFPGVKLAPAQGDPAKGASHFFIKFAPGFSAPEHHHTANHYVTVLAGTLVLKVDGQDHSLSAGSFFSFTGQKKHTTRCAEGAECLLAIDCRGKWDVVPEAAPKKE
jgi:quercetin dioxygenase-like cupin family protein